MNWFGSKPKVQADTQPAIMGFDDFEVRLGDLMRGERATLGKSLLDVQRELHIRATYIAGIESGDLTAFEAPSFVAGYVRSYARYLGMDPEKCFAQFRLETGFAVSPDLQRALPPAKVDVPVTREFNTGMLGRSQLAAQNEPIWKRLNLHGLASVAVLLALIAGVGSVGWYALQEVQRVKLVPADQPPDVMAELDPVLSGAAPRMGDADAAGLRVGAGAMANAEGIVRVYRPEALEAPVMVARDGPIAAILPREPSAPVIDTTDAVLAALGDGVRVTGDGPAQVEVLAVRPSWVRVRGADGTVLFEKVLNAGERYLVPASEQPPVLRAGNSGSVYMLLDGAPYGPLAAGAQVVDNILLSPDAVTDRLVEADLSGDRDLETFVAVAQAE